MLYLIYNKLHIHKYKYTAIIVEPREHKALDYVLTNFYNNLSDEWQIIVFHGNNNTRYVKNIINKFNKNRIKLINLNVNNLTIPEYCKLFYSKWLYNNIPTETFLVFQTDTLICPQYKHLINDFLKYDYVGAPWGKTLTKEIIKVYGGKDAVGNGGLSIRKKSKMLKILDKYSTRHKDGWLINEDVFFSIHSKYKPTAYEARNFSIESVYNNKSFGVHKAYKYVKLDWFPELKLLEKLNELNPSTNSVCFNGYNMASQLLSK
jgi:hypothetical protein